MDYIYFFYGLSFLVFGGVCFTLTRKNAGALPWFWLGLFGCMYGLYEWLELVAYMFADSVLFSSLRCVFLMLPMYCLCLFGILGLHGNTEKRLRVWFIFAGIFIVGMSVLNGIPGAHAALRYSLGFPGAALVALVFFKFARAFVSLERISLLVISASFLAFAFLTGIAVPRIPFYLPALFSTDSFLRTFALPVQLGCGVCAFCAAGGILLFYHNFSLRGVRKHTGFGRVEMSTVVLIFLFFIILGGAVFTNFLGVLKTRQVTEDAVRRLAIVKVDIETVLLKVDQGVRSLSEGMAIAPALEAGADKETIDKANATLDRYQKSFEYTVCFLLNTEGLVIASSNRDTPDNFIGMNYATRPYFKEAMQGKSGNYFAVGLTTKKRGYFSTCPVYGQDKSLIGAVVIKQELDTVILNIRTFGFLFLVDPQGVIFISSDPAHAFQCVWPMSDATRASIQNSEQFADLKPGNLLRHEPVSGSNIFYQGRNYYIVRAFLGRGGWSLIEMMPIDDVWHYRAFGMLLTLFLFILAIVMYYFIRQEERIAETIETSNEKLRHIDNLKSYFVSVASHELRSPLTILKEQSRIILDKIAGPLNEKQERILRSHLDTLDRLTRTTDNLLDLSKIEAGKMDLRRQYFSITDVVQETVEFFKPMAKEKHLTLSSRLPEYPISVYAEKDKIIQVLTNLISNALKFTKEGSIEVSLGERDDMIECSVFDTGPGISAEDLPRVFGKFEQLNVLATGGEKGTGLGLAIAKSIIEMHGGKIWVTSEPGLGAKFYFSLPRLDMFELMNESIHCGIKRREEVFILGVVLLTECPDAVFTTATELIGAAFKGVSLLSRSKEGELIALLRCESNDAISTVSRLGRTIKEAMKKNGFESFDKVRYGYAFYPIDGFTAGELMEKARQTRLSLSEMLFKKQIMIVDDEPDFVETLSLNLQKIGFRDIIKCHDSAEGLVVLEKETPDIILVDMKLPQMSGYEFVGRLKENVKTKDIPIIIMSAYTVEMEHMGDFAKKKAIPMVNKPFTVKELYAWLNVLL